MDFCVETTEVVKNERFRYFPARAITSSRVNPVSRISQRKFEGKGARIQRAPFVLLEGAKFGLVEHALAFAFSPLTPICLSHLELPRSLNSRAGGRLFRILECLPAVAPIGDAREKRLR